MQGRQKLPISYVNDRVLNYILQLSRKPNLDDLKLGKLLFMNPPRRVHSTSNNHNQSVLNRKPSIFDVPNAENDSSLSLSSTSSSDSEAEETFHTFEERKVGTSECLLHIFNDIFNFIHEFNKKYDFFSIVQSCRCLKSHQASTQMTFQIH